MESSHVAPAGLRSAQTDETVVEWRGQGKQLTHPDLHEAKDPLSRTFPFLHDAIFVSESLLGSLLDGIAA